VADAYIRAFGAYLPERAVGNRELAERLGCTPEWIVEMSGIEERRYAAPGQTVACLAAAAGKQCLERAGAPAPHLDMILVASGSGERRFPGPAVEVAAQLGAPGIPALDLPMASAGGLVAVALAADLLARYPSILVIAAEKMSAVVTQDGVEKGTAMLFGDGAGACLVGTRPGPLSILDSALHSDGAYSEDLHLEFGGGLAMNGRSIILQASRKLPAVILELLERNALAPQDVSAFLLHQANQNLMDRVARALGVEPRRFPTNIRRYGNTSSASLLIAASEWWEAERPAPGARVCFAAFGAGVHWGAALCEVA
jgi:3-oxoacyl-[acyl-carrier-protein] synthase-3